MGAIHVFDASHQRAVQLIELYDLLVNKNRRAIGANWELKFKRLMRWGRSEVIYRTSNRYAFIVLREASGKDTSSFTHSNLCYLLKAGIVLAVGAMDSYFHDIIREKALFLLSTTGASVPKELKELTLSIEDFIKHQHSRDQTLSLSEALSIPLGYRAFQTTSKIANKGLRLIGLPTTFWADVAQRMGNSSELQLTQRIDQLVERRNQIVHEGDQERDHRSGEIKERYIDSQWAKDEVAFIRDVVYQADNIIMARVR